MNFEAFFDTLCLADFILENMAGEVDCEIEFWKVLVLTEIFQGSEAPICLDEIYLGVRSKQYFVN